MNSKVTPIVMPIDSANSFRMKVKYLPGLVNIRGKKEFQAGVAVAQNGDHAEFDFGSSRDCAINAGEIVFGTGKPCITKIGDEIIGVVEENRATHRWMVTRWTHASEYKKAVLQLGAQNAPKPAPAIPYVAPIIPIADKKPGQNRDRRQTVRLITAEPLAHAS